jgi:predicted nucleotidyltransferase
MSDKALQKLITEFAKVPTVNKVILFGSRARGDHRPRSDIDLAIEAPFATNSHWLHINSIIEEADTLLSIDLVRLDEASDNIKDKIFQEGQLLHARPEKPAESQ